MEKRLTKEWEVSAFNRETNQWETAMNHAYEPIAEDEDFVRQAKPVVIKPTTRKKPTRDCYTEVFFGDTHHPFHDQRKLDLAMIALREIQPDRVTFLGDDLDNALFSRFESRSEWANSTQAGLDSFAETLAQTRANIGSDADIVVHEGNHNIRLEREIRKYNGELMGLRRAASEELGVLTVGFLMDFDRYDAEYVTGYPQSEYWHTDTLKSFHGKVTGGNSAVAKQIGSQNVNFVHGHTHKAGIVYRTFRNGRDEDTIFGMEAGTFADREQVPTGAYAQSESGNVLRQAMNWQTMLGVIHHNEEMISPTLIPITNNGILLGERMYRG